jgi:hypothetical protein
LDSADALRSHQHLNTVGGRLLAEINGHIKIRRAFGALIFPENIPIGRIDFAGELKNAGGHPHIELLDEFRGIDLFRGNRANRYLMGNEKNIFVRAGQANTREPSPAFT